jgi:hypothetical protein
MLMVVAALSTPLAAQSAWSLGFAATLGGGWQLEGADVGYLRDLHLGPIRSATVGARLGTFIDEGAIVGGSRGFLGGLGVALRTGLATLADVGNETNPTPFGLDLTVEVAGYAANNTPLSVGSPWVAISILPGLLVGSGEGPRYSVVVGPMVDFGSGTTVRAFLGLRFEVPRMREKS